MKQAELDILLSEGKGSMLEFKERLSASFARELVALANTAGGRILLGVSDDGSVKGVPDSNELRARIQSIARNCDPPVKLLHRDWFNEGANVFVEIYSDRIEISNPGGLPEGLKDAEHFRRVYLVPALEAGWIEMTIPDKPRSSLQRYNLAKGA